MLYKIDNSDALIITAVSFIIILINRYNNTPSTADAVLFYSRG
jgi:hypothetical protein